MSPTAETRFPDGSTFSNRMPKARFSATTKSPIEMTALNSRFTRSMTDLFVSFSAVDEVAIKQEPDRNRTGTRRVSYRQDSEYSVFPITKLPKLQHMRNAKVQR